MFKRLISSIVCFTFIFSNLQYIQAQDFSINQLPVPGTMVGVSTPFAPLALKGLIVNPQKPLEFQFIVDTGNSFPKGMSSPNALVGDLKQQANQLVKYFLAGLTIPEGDLWVNLSPYEKSRIVPEALGQTDLGRDLLAQDYILKQLTASFIYPEKDLGKEFWSRVYAKAQQQFGTTNIPVNTFNKVWILPDQAQVFENDNAAYVTKSTLKVMLDEDYTALQKHVSLRGAEGDAAISERTTNNTRSIASQIVREIVIPEITKEVNTGKNFAPLRQIYQALILAKWYKETIQNGLLDALYTNKNKVAGVNLKDPAVKEQIYNRYLQAYKKGAFNYIKEEPTPDGQVVQRKYFSGGFKWVVKIERTHNRNAMFSARKLIAGALVLLTLVLGPVANSVLAQSNAPTQKILSEKIPGEEHFLQLASEKKFDLNQDAQTREIVSRYLFGISNRLVNIQFEGPAKEQEAAFTSATPRIGIKPSGFQVDIHDGKPFSYPRFDFQIAGNRITMVIRSSQEGASFGYDLKSLFYVDGDLIIRFEGSYYRVHDNKDSEHPSYNVKSLETLKDIGDKAMVMDVDLEKSKDAAMLFAPTRLKWILKHNSGDTLTSKLRKFLARIKDPKTLKEILEILGNSQKKEAIKPIEIQLRNIDPGVRQKAREALEKLGMHPRSLSIALAAAEKLRKNHDELAVRMESDAEKNAPTREPKAYNFFSDFLNRLGDPRGAYRYGYSESKGWHKYPRADSSMLQTPKQIQDAAMLSQVRMNNARRLIERINEVEAQIRKIQSATQTNDPAVMRRLQSLERELTKDRGKMPRVIGLLKISEFIKVMQWPEKFHAHVHYMFGYLSQRYPKYTMADAAEKLDLSREKLFKGRDESVSIEFRRILSFYGLSLKNPRTALEYIQASLQENPVILFVHDPNRDFAWLKGKFEDIQGLDIYYAYSREDGESFIKKFNKGRLKIGLIIIGDQIPVANNEIAKDKEGKNWAMDLDKRYPTMPIVLQARTEGMSRDSQIISRSGWPFQLLIAGIINSFAESAKKAQKSNPAMLDQMPLLVSMESVEEAKEMKPDAAMLNSITGYSILTLVGLGSGVGIYYRRYLGVIIKGFWQIGQMLLKRDELIKILRTSDKNDAFEYLRMTFGSAAFEALSNLYLHQIGMADNFRRVDGLPDQWRNEVKIKYIKKSYLDYDPRLVIGLVRGLAEFCHNGNQFKETLEIIKSLSENENYRDDDAVHKALTESLETIESKLKSIKDQGMEDKALLAENGGIDLNQIDVNRTGKTVNVHFDPAQLNELMQGGFEGFTPVIINMTPISSPFQLLGINTAKQEVVLAKA